MNLLKIKKNKSIKELLEFGIINIDKPSGPTSFNVSDFVRSSLNLRKTSHFGTLDPKVTGVLPIALNRACKLTGFFLGEDKEYVGIMRIHKEISLDTIDKKIKEKFIGEIFQVPPVKSRVKREKRVRRIYEFNLLEKQGKDILFKVKSQGGTYIRKLIHDLGIELGIGAHMLELRRMSAGIFSEERKQTPLVNLYDFEKAVNEYKEGNEKLLRKMIIPGEIVSEVYPVVQIQREYIKKVFQGSPVFNYFLKEDESNNFKPGKIICIFSDERFIGMFEIKNHDDVFAKSLFTMQPLNK